MRRLAAVALAWQALAVAAVASPVRLFDAVLAAVDGRTVAASDIALARALGMFGLTPSTGAIDRADIDRFVDGLLILEEATRVGITADPAQVDRVWATAIAGWGDEATFQRWLDAHALGQARARRFAEDEAVRARFLETRFVEMAEDETAETDRREWLAATRRRAAIRVLLPDGASAPLPFPPR